MKTIKLLFILSLGFLFLPWNSMAQTYNSPVDYMQQITDAMETTKRDTWKYLKAVTRGKRARKVERKRENLLEEIRNAKNIVRKMAKYDAEDPLRESVLDYLDMSYTVLREDYDKILDMEDIAEQSYDAMEAYLLAKEKASEKLNSSFDKVVEAQKEFAEQHDITLQEAEMDRTSEKIVKANETLKYYNDIYLIFFKAYKQEVYVMDALERNDLNSFEQSVNSLSAYADEGIKKLRELESFKGDASLKAGSRRILMFYKNEADRDFATLTDYFIKKDNFEKIKKSFEAKKKRDRTQKDIDQFNKAVKDYNAAAKKANRILEGGNSKRERYLENWNKTVENFFDNHA